MFRWQAIIISMFVVTLLTSVSKAAQNPIEVKDPSQFIVEVKGIVCAFCAYGARKNLERVDFIDRKIFTNGLLMETDKGAITVAISKGKKINFAQTFRAIQRGGYEILAMHLNLVGKPEKKNGDTILIHKYNEQEFLLFNKEGKGWDAKENWGKEISIQVYAPNSVIANAEAGKALAVTVKETASGQGTHLHLNVEGMHCSKCAERLQKVLNAKGGIRSASVNFEEKSAVVSLDPSLTSEKEIVEVVKEAGFSATVKK